MTKREMRVIKLIDLLTHAPSFFWLIFGAGFLGIGLGHYFRWLDGANNLGAVLFYGISGILGIIRSMYLRNAGY